MKKFKDVVSEYTEEGSVVVGGVALGALLFGYIPVEIFLTIITFLPPVVQTMMKRKMKKIGQIGEQM